MTLDVLHNSSFGVTVSSPLAAPHAVGPLHIDKVGRSSVTRAVSRQHIRASLLSLFAEWIALSAVDVMIHSASGLSGSAAMWGGLPPESIRRLEHVSASTQSSDACKPGTYVPAYYAIECTL